MPRKNGAARAYGPSVTWWACVTCGQYVASTDEHERILWAVECEHVNPVSDDWRWCVRHGVIVGAYQGQLFDPNRPPQ
jgi:hypothetical protein